MFFFNCFIEACSWRSNSTRCYPGHCENELAANCRCVSGFGGRHCEKSMIKYKQTSCLKQYKYDLSDSL